MYNGTFQDPQRETVHRLLDKMSQASPKDPSSLSLMEGPKCLIESDPGSGVLRLVPDVAEELYQLEKPCVVVAIAGTYRTGKSYLMNRLAGLSNGRSEYMYY